MSHGAILLAAGNSSRMQAAGQAPCKALVPLPVQAGPSTPLALLCTLYREAGVEPLVVVGGRHTGAVTAAARALGAGVAHNLHTEYGMFSSLCVGMRTLLAQSPGMCGVFVHPVDVPLVRLPSVQALLAAQVESTVCVPTFAGRRGHPVLVPSPLLPALLAWEPRPDVAFNTADAPGLRGFMAANPVREVPVADELILHDMDTPDEYAALCALATRRHVLDPEEAATLLALHGLPERGQAHCHAVGLVSAAFARAVNTARGLRGLTAMLDVQLAHSGGVLHDICKGQPRHERAGGELLRRLGLVALAPLVEDHRDLTLPDDAPITERELVYLADKFVRGSRPVSLDERFRQKRECFAADPAACEAIKGRQQRAEALAARLERECGQSPLAIARVCLSTAPPALD